MALQQGEHDPLVSELAKRAVAVRRGDQRLALLRWLTVLVALALWEWGAGRWFNDLFTSRPSAIVTTLVAGLRTREMITDIWVTLQEMLLGYGIGVGLGLVVGYLLGTVRPLGRFMEPFILVFNSIPKVALAPLLIIWLGIGIMSKVGIAAMMVFFMMYYNVYLGTTQLKQDYVDSVRLMGAGWWTVLRWVVLPALGPYVMTGLRMGIVYTVIGAITGEFTASSKGIGYRILYAAGTLNASGIFAGIAILMLFVVIGNVLLNLLERRLLRWQSQSR